MTYSALKVHQNTGRGELISKIRFQPVDSLPPACALPSAPSLLISTTKLQHKSPESKNQPFIIRKNLLTNRPFRLKKPKRYVCALQRIFMHFIYILFAECKRHAAIPYSITVLQYYSLPFWNCYRSLLYI